MLRVICLIEVDVVIVDTRKDLNVYKWMSQEDQTGCCGQSGTTVTEEEVRKFDFNEWAGKFLLRLT